MNKNSSLKKLSKDFFTADRNLLFILIILTIFTRIVAIQIIETGGDAINYWFHAKKFLLGLPYGNLSHQTTRFGMIIPIYLVQKLFSAHPLVYYTAPLLFSIFQTTLLYKIGIMIHSRRAAFLSCLLIIIFPTLIRTGTQILPGTFSPTYILLSIYLFLKYSRTENKKYLYLILSALSLFIAYETKITNLFFMPGIALAIWIDSKKIKDVIIFGSILLSLFLIETFLYSHFAGFSLGRLEAIMNVHFQDTAHLVSMSFPDLFQRYTSLGIYYKIPFILFAVSSIILLKNNKIKEIKYSILIAGSFFFCITFAVKSINPIVPAEPFQQRYFCAALPIVMFIISYSCFELAEYISNKRGRKADIEKNNIKKTWKITAFYSTLTMIIAAVFFTGIVIFKPARDSEGRHPFSYLIEYYSTLNEYYDEGIPMIDYQHTNPRALRTFIFVFYDFEKKNRMVPEIKNLKVGDKTISYIVSVDSDRGNNPGLIRKGPVIELKRPPFRAGKIENLLNK